MSGAATGPVDDRLLTRAFGLVTATAALYFFAVGALNALIPLFVVDHLERSEAVSGLVMGSQAITALATRVWFGRAADRHGARRIMVIGGILAIVSMAVLTVFSSLGGAVASRLVLGAGTAGMVTGSTLLAMELAPAHRRGEAASYVMVSFHLGLGLGPVLGEAVLRAGSYDAVWLTVAGFAALATVAATRVPHHVAEPLDVPPPLVSRQALAPGVVSLFGVVAFNGFLMFIPLYAEVIGLRDAGLVFTVASLTTVVVRMAGARLPDLLGPARTGSAALILTMVATAVVAFWAAPTGVFVGAALLAAGLSLQSPSFLSMAIDGVPAKERGAAVATFTAFFDLANAINGPVFGLIVTLSGYRPAFLFGGAMALVALILLQFVARRRRAEDETGGGPTLAPA
ncbi:MAG: MFS transporter [Acidimicrobiales bacterium]